MILKLTQKALDEFKFSLTPYATNLVYCRKGRLILTTNETINICDESVCKNKCGLREKATAQITISED